MFYFSIVILIIFAAYKISITVKNNKVQVEIAINNYAVYADSSKKIPNDKNGAVIYNQIFKLISSPKLKDSVDKLTYINWNENHYDWNKLQYETSKVKSVILMIESAQKKPYCKFQAINNASLDKTTYDNFKMLSMLLSTCAIVKAHDGHIEESVKYIKLGYRLGEPLKTRSNFIQFLRYQNMVDITSVSFEKTLDFGNISADQSKQIYDILSTIDFDKAFIRALEGQKAYGLAMIKHTYSDPHVESLLINNQNVFLKEISAQFKIAQMRYRDAKKEGLIKPETEMNSYNSVALMMAQSINYILIYRDNTIAKISLYKVGLACHAYKSKVGHYPKSLSELKKVIKWKLPDDPYSGKDLIYHRKGTGFLIYSIGADLIDNGGLTKDSLRDKYVKKFSKNIIIKGRTIPGLPESIARKIDNKTGDIVWYCNK